jgi:hypothetical protein
MVSPAHTMIGQSGLGCGGFTTISCVEKYVIDSNVNGIAEEAQLATELAYETCHPWPAFPAEPAVQSNRITGYPMRVEMLGMVVMDVPANDARFSWIEQSMVVHPNSFSTWAFTVENFINVSEMLFAPSGAMYHDTVIATPPLMVELYGFAVFRYMYPCLHVKVLPGAHTLSFEHSQPSTGVGHS